MYHKQKIHFVGIGGVGMSGIAEVLHNLKYPVSGSDLKSSMTTRRLKKKGISVSIGHKSQNLGDAQVVVISSAVKPTNPELIEAKARHIPIIQRAEMLAELMRFSKYGIAVSGTHGKTTTTSLIASSLYAGGIDPTMIIGGRVNSFRSNARLGKGDFMVAEADESDGSFLKLSPTIVVITSVDREHMDFYSSFEQIQQAFLEFANKVPFYGLVVACSDHPVVKQLIPKIDKRVVTYGFKEGADFQASNLEFEGAKTHFDLTVRGESKGRFTVNLAGAHNVLNSLATLAVSEEIGISFKKTNRALKTFKGIHRRCEVLLDKSNICVIDDYGHHPEEIRVTLKAVRGAFSGRLVTLFQPHRYTRTKDLFEDFLNAFDDAALTLITDIYAAGETPIEGISSKKLVERLQSLKKNVQYLPKMEAMDSLVIPYLQPGDILLTLGAGDVTQMGRQLAKSLKKYDFNGTPLSPAA